VLQNYLARDDHKRLLLIPDNPLVRRALEEICDPYQARAADDGFKVRTHASTVIRSTWTAGT
jgi:hypothetical protein